MALAFFKKMLNFGAKIQMFSNFFLISFYSNGIRTYQFSLAQRWR